ncbi:MAG: MgtC/SapB family protein [Anaerohalosphaeraceae bacterium]|jgi:putative Mg2+ transporter-C (MgtC) family protein
MEFISDYLDFRSFIPLAFAMGLGAIIGIEREIHGKPAGLRTNILICMGAATFMMIANRMLASPDAISRMTAGIVTGVGFIGGAVVLRDRTNVYGVTTAATIWVVTSIGIACGMQLYDIAVAVTLLSLLILVVLNPLDRKIHKPSKETE